MTSARSVCMSVSRAFGAGLCGVGKDRANRTRKNELKIYLNDNEK